MQRMGPTIGQVEHAVLVDGEHLQGGVVAGGDSRSVDGGAGQRIVRGRGVERCRQLGTLTVHDQCDAVQRLEPDLIGVGYPVDGLRVEILKVEHPFSASCTKPARPRRAS